jgi:hypothetical protein
VPFHEKAHTEADTEAARKVTDQIYARARAGMSPSSIASSFKPRLKTGAVREILAERTPEPEPSSPPNPPVGPLGGSRSAREYEPEPEPREPPPPRPSWQAPAWQRPTPPESPEPPAYTSGSYSTGSTEDLLFTILIEAGVPAPKAKGVVRRFTHRQPNDFGGLNQILLEAGLSVPARTSVLGAYREETEGPTSPTGSESPGAFGGDAISQLRRERREQQIEELERLRYEAERRRYERELALYAAPTNAPAPAGPDPSTAARLSALESENARLQRDLALKDVEARSDAKLQALKVEYDKKIETLSASTSLTLDKVQIERERSVALAEAESRKALTDLATRKLAETGELRKGVIDAGAPKLVMDVIRTNLGGDDARGTPEQPDQATLRALTDRLEAQERGPPQDPPAPSPPPGAVGDAPRRLRRITVPEARADAEPAPQAAEPGADYQSG